MSLMGTAFKVNMLDKYFELEKEIYDYFGYDQGWRMLQLSDETESFWTVANDDRHDHVCFGSAAPDDEAEWMYSLSADWGVAENRWVYRGEDYTMLVLDTQQRSKVLVIFDNKKEVAND